MLFCFLFVAPPTPLKSLGVAFDFLMPMRQKEMRKAPIPQQKQKEKGAFINRTSKLYVL